jgi:hypothetical protein
MSKKARIQQKRLEAMESEFQTLLLSCLAECAKGRYGLFGQNSHLDPEERYWRWPEAKHLRELASQIRIERSHAGASPLSERFLELCAAKDPNTAGEPKLASRLLDELQERV